MSKIESVDVAKIIATPSRLAQYLAPKIWGEGAVYRADPWVLKLEEGVLDALMDRENQRFVKSNAPSQIGKSMYDEVFVPFWALGYWPDTRIILIGYSDAIAQRSGGMVRDLVKLYGPELFNIEIDPDYQSKGDWKLGGRQGGMLSVGIGSQITGRSADLCVAEGTMVATPDGEVAVEQLASIDRPIILSYDERHGTARQSLVTASKRTVATAAVEIRTTGGRTLCCTPDHRVYVAGCGYVEAQVLQPGDRLRALRSLSSSPGGRPGEDALRLLPGGASAQPGGVHLSDLREGLLDDDGRCAQAPEIPAGRRPLLLEGMLRASATRQVSMWSTCVVEGGEDLFAGVPTSVQSVASDTDRQALRDVRQHDDSGLQPDEILFDGLPESVAVGTVHRNGQSELASRPEPTGLVLQGAPVGPAAGRPTVRHLREDQGSRRTPPRREPEQQRDGQPRHALPPLSHAAPQVDDDTVASVTHLDRAERVFYDLTVPGDNNFFAGGLVVHNCIIGDVIKNMEEAGSKATKDHHWEEWEGSIETRAQPGSTYLLAATRFADDDLSGRFEAQAREPDNEVIEWESYIFPAIAEPRFDEDGDDPEWRDIIGRRRGEPLQTRFSKPGDELEENWESSYFYKLRQRKSPFAWSAIYQQEPTSPTGGMFPTEAWAWYDPDNIPPLMGVRRSWDLAASEGEGDWTVGTKIGKTFDGDFLVLDVLRERRSGGAVKAWVEAVAAVDGVACPLIIERERSGAGKTVLEFYALALPMFQVRPGVPDGSKEDRARPASLLQQSMRLKLPRRADGTSPEWVAGYIDELRKMMGDGRKGRHDDQIDTTAYAVNDMLDESVTYMAHSSLKFSHDRGLMAV